MPHSVREIQVSGLANHCSASVKMMPSGLQYLGNISAYNVTAKWEFILQAPSS
jgi:hypothetical protein